MTEAGVGPPVLVHLVHVRVQQVGDELRELDPCAALRHVLRPDALAVLADDRGAEALLEVLRGGVVLLELVPEGGDDALDGMAYEQELGVAVELRTDLRLLAGEEQRNMKGLGSAYF